MSIPSQSRRVFLTFLWSSIGCLLSADCVISLSGRIKPRGIVIHHSALPTDEGLNEITNLHRYRGFGAFYWYKIYIIGYHYIISPDGLIHNIRPEHLRGAHARGANDMIGICILGNFDSSAGSLTPTIAQMTSLKSLCSNILHKYGLNATDVHKHSEVDSYTVCPGDHFPFADLLGSL